MKRKALALVYVIFAAALIMLAVASASRIIYINAGCSVRELERLSAFWAAEAGLEWAKSQLADEPDWYSDLPHLPTDDIPWILAASAGYTMSMKGSAFKVVRERGLGRCYAVGYTGESPEGAGAISVLKLEFATGPFRVLRWRSL